MKDPEDAGPDGITIKDRMQPLIVRIAKSIRECGSACHAYLKKSFLCESLVSIITPQISVLMGSSENPEMQDL